MTKPTDAERLAKQLLAGSTPEEGRALLESLLSGQVSSIFEKLQTAEPTLRSAPPRSAASAFASTCTERSHRSGGGWSCPAT